MIKLKISKGEKSLLNKLRYEHPHPKIQKRCQIVWLKSQGYKVKEVMKICGVSRKTHWRAIRLFQAGGVEELKKLNYPKHRSALYAYKADIEADLEANPPSTINEAGERIRKLTGIKRSHKQVRLFLLGCGFRFRKVAAIPSKADVEKQEKFITEKLEPKLEEAKNGKRAVFFVDAAHFVMGAFLGYLWSCARLFVKSSSGRSRFNVLGAIDAINKKFVKVTNDSYINATSVCALLKEITSLNLGVPITLILDNARYQKCKIVTELAATLDIELLYLPPYSPNLNLIERLWRFVKKKCLYAHYYEDFAAFKDGIISCLDKTEFEYKKEIDSLLNPKFQTFKNVSILNR